MNNLPTFGNSDPDAPLYGPETLDPHTGLVSQESLNPSNSSDVNSSPFNDILSKAEAQHRSYGSTALYIFVNSSSFKHFFRVFFLYLNPIHVLYSLR